MKKVKRLLVLVICMTLFNACGGVEVKNQDNEITQSENNINKEDGSNTDINSISFSNSYKVPLKKIVIDVPNYQEIECGYTNLYILNGIKYVAFTSALDNYTETTKDAHELAFNIFIQNIQDYSFVNSLNITSESTETINDIEVYRYEGTLNCGHDTIYDAYVIGYSFIMDGVPCTVTGSVIDQAQEQEMIDEMRDTVEAMMQTLRSER